MLTHPPRLFHTQGGRSKFKKPLVLFTERRLPLKTITHTHTHSIPISVKMSLALGLTSLRHHVSENTSCATGNSPVTTDPKMTCLASPQQPNSRPRPNKLQTTPGNPYFSFSHASAFSLNPYIKGLLVNSENAPSCMAAWLNDEWGADWEKGWMARWQTRASEAPR